MSMGADRKFRLKPYGKYILRDLSRSRSQAAVFILCVVLAIVTLVAVNGFSGSVTAALMHDARALHAADIIIQSRQPISPLLNSTLDRMKQEGQIQSSRTYEFYSVVQAANGSGTLLSNIKAVSEAYPLYGSCELASGKSLAAVLLPGKIVVERNLLERMGLDIGDQLDIGRARLMIADIVVREPDRPVTAFALGPRVFVSEADLALIDLVQKGSRVRFGIQIKAVDPADLKRLTDKLTAAADPVQERVDTYRSARSGVKRFFDNFIDFLNLVGIFTLLLAGIGIHSTLTAYLKEKEKTIAIMKTVGATNRFIFTHFTVGLLLLSLIGTLLGLAVGFAAQNILPIFFEGLIPQQARLNFSWAGTFQGFIVGVVGVALFAARPLGRLKNIRPASIFRKETRRKESGWLHHMSLMGIIVFFSGIILWQLQDIRSGLQFVIGIGGFLLLAAGFVHATLLILKHIKVKSLVWRQSTKGLFRPDNATHPIMITLTAALAVIFTIHVVEKNLDHAFVRSYPPDAPNLFFLDIQPEQKIDFDRALGMETRYFPVVRAKIVSINGQRIDRKKEQSKHRGDNLARTFNLTYRADLLDDEIIVSGGNLFRSDWQEPQVSVLDSVLEMHDMTVGDRLVFRIQGVPLEARVSSIRSRVKDSFKPFFYFVFEEDTLIKAPQTIFTAVKVDKDKIADLQNAIVKKFPNVSAFDMADTIATFTAVARKLADTISFFSAFSILAGMLIAVSSVFATRLSRTREAVFYRVLGARNSFVLRIFGLENFLIGSFSGLIALVVSQVAGWVVVTRVFDVVYAPFVGPIFVMILSASVLVVICGLVPSWPILRQRPLSFLREQNQE
jgi:putative ABC transport system permease protein